MDPGSGVPSKGTSGGWPASGGVVEVELSFPDNVSPGKGKIESNGADQAVEYRLGRSCAASRDAGAFSNRDFLSSDSPVSRCGRMDG